MPKIERIEKIKQLLAHQNRIDVNQLSQLLNVSKVTIRNDLKMLETEGVLKRTHGGAIANTVSLPRTISSLDSSTALSAPDRRINRIAQRASQYINEKEWIFLGSGSTCYAIAKAAAHKNVQIVTNNLFIGTYLAPYPNINVIMCGGKVHTERIPFLSGDLALNNIASMCFSKAFIGVSGADFKYGYSVSNDVECNIFKTLQECSQEIVIATDSSKFDHAAFMSLGRLDIADVIISDTGMPDAYKDYYESINTTLLLT